MSLAREPTSVSDWQPEMRGVPEGCWWVSCPPACSWSLLHRSNSLPAEAVQSPFLQIFEIFLDKALSSLFCPHSPACCEHEVGLYTSKVPSSLTCAVIQRPMT